MKKNLPVLLALIAVLIISSCKKDSTTTSCGVATGMTTSAITSTSATFTWTAVTGAVSYLIQYRVVGTTTWSPATSTTATYAATGLTAGSKYEWQVQTVCSSGGAAYTASTNFTTLTVTQPTALIKTMNESIIQGGVSGSVDVSYVYDNQNRLTLMVTAITYSSAYSADSTTYSYGSSTVTMVDQQSGTTIYTLNAAGYRVSDNMSDTWTYNTAGYLTSSNVGGTVTTNTYDSQNRLLTASQNPGSQTDTYTYSANAPALPFISWQTGNSTGALYATDVQVINSTTTTYTATYTTDAQGRVTQSVVTSTGSGTVTTNYTYY
jgi:hypothetical protein